MLLIVWQFRPAPGREAEFVHAYGTDGPWVALFRKASGYRESVLAQDASDPERFLTLDAEPSRNGRVRFKLIGSWYDDVVVVAIVSPLGSEAIDIVSVRPANKSERALYDIH